MIVPSSDKPSPPQGAANWEAVSPPAYSQPALAGETSRLLPGDQRPLSLPGKLRHRKALTRVSIKLVAPIAVLVFIACLVFAGLYRPGIGEIETRNPEDNWPSSHCLEPQDWKLSKSLPSYRHTYTSSHTVPFPLSLETLLFTAFNFSEGHFRMLEPQRDEVHQNELMVDITLKHDSLHALASSQVLLCSLKRRSGELGLVLSANHSLPIGTFDVDINVRLPYSSSPLAVTRINHLRILLHNFVHVVGDLARNFEFGTLSLWTHKTVIIKSLSAENLVLGGENGEMSGSLKVSKSMTVELENTTFAANVGLWSYTAPTKLTLSNKNGKTNTTLILQSPGMYGGKFDVNVDSTNGPVNVDFLGAPAESDLQLLVNSKSGPASVHLHPTFEGTVRSSSKPVVKEDNSVVDPLHQGPWSSGHPR